MKRFLAICSAFLLIVVKAAIVDAVPITSMSDASLLGGTTIDFESETQGDYASITIADVTFSTNTGTMRVSNDSNGEFVPPKDMFLDNKYGGGVFTFTLNTDVSAFGIQVGATNDTWTFSAYDLGNVLLESLLIPNQVQDQPYPYTGYYGFDQGSTLISYLTLSQTGGSGDWIVLDDVMYNNGSNRVPEPGTMLLLGFGLIGMIGYKKKNSSKS